MNMCGSAAHIHIVNLFIIFMITRLSLRQKAQRENQGSFTNSTRWNSRTARYVDG